MQKALEIQSSTISKSLDTVHSLESKSEDIKSLLTATISTVEMHTE